MSLTANHQMKIALKFILMKETTITKEVDLKIKALISYKFIVEDTLQML